MLKNRDIDKHVINFCIHFQRRGYPPKFLEDAALTARRLNRIDLLNKPIPLSKETDTGKIIMVTKYRPEQDPLREIVTNNWDFLGKTTTTHHLFEKKLMVGYRRLKNLRDLIVRADVRLKEEKDIHKVYIPPRKLQRIAKTLAFPKPSKKKIFDK